MDGLRAAFYVSAVMSFIAAVASAMRGGRVRIEDAKETSGPASAAQ
jgi:hypothetical protein